MPAGVYFRLQLGGITGHGDFARDTGVLLTPEQCVPVAAAVVRVFIEHGDRTDRKRARLKYVLDAWGLERFLAETEKHLPASRCRACRSSACRAARAGRQAWRISACTRSARPVFAISASSLPVGRLTAAQMRGLADDRRRATAAARCA